MGKLHMNPYKLFIIISLFFAYFVNANRAHAERFEDDFRAKCRSDVGGKLVKAQNDVDLLSATINAWVTRSIAMQNEISKLRKKVSELKEKTTHLSYDRNREDELMAYSHRLKLVEVEFEQQSKLMKNHEKTRAQDKKFLSDFKKAIDPVFKIVSLEAMKQKGGYSFKVEYRHPCSPFNLICALPVNQRKALAKLAVDFNQLTSCKRYAQILPHTD